MSYYIGNTPQDILDGFIKRYLYGMRRNQDGEVFVIRSDQLQGGPDNAVTINELGDSEENYPFFEEGIDYLDGIDLEHNIVYENLRYPQIKWEGRSLVYFIDPVDGQLVVRISEGYEYPDGISAEGF